MKFTITTLLLIWVISLTFSCQSFTEPAVLDEKVWHLGWRMVESTWDENYELASLQFDSLLATNKPISDDFLIRGLMIKEKLVKHEEVLQIIADQSPRLQGKICEGQFARDFKPCKNIEKTGVQNETLQLTIIKLFVADQAIRGHLMRDVIAKYNIDTTSIKTEYQRTIDEVNIDEVNRNHLKVLFEEFGFPTRQEVGADAMQGIFLIIQHADGDKEWQKSQLQNIEIAVQNGDLPKKNYAYLYDRINVNDGQQQRFGTQFLKVDKINQLVKLRDTEDVINLDNRRREMGMMPIAMYKRLILRD